MSLRAALNWRSLRVRLAIVSTVLIVLALVLTGIGLSITFQAALTERAAQELTENVRLLSGYVAVDDAGRLRLERELPDTRAVHPYGGLYWQIVGDRETLRSRSLWDAALPPPAAQGAPGITVLREESGPRGESLIAAERGIIVTTNGVPHGLRITVALDTAQLDPVRHAFSAVLVPGLVLAGVVLAAVMAVLFGIAMAPFRTLRSAIAELLAGRSRVLTGRFPDEVLPVVSELNRVLRHESDSLARARLQAGDLAHGLKTPLAVLAKIGRDAQERGDARMAAEIRAQVAVMDNHVTRSLARTRAGLNAAQAHHSVAIGPVVDKLARMMRRLADADRAVAWHVAIDAAAFPGDETDLFEILGAILDNARKWAASEVTIRTVSSPADLSIIVEDDGPGLPDPTLVENGRGTRLDEARSGTGFGLAIARDLVEAYGGVLAVGKSPAGGLAVTIRIPCAA